jgi:hypothetical protein
MNEVAAYVLPQAGANARPSQKMFVDVLDTVGVALSDPHLPEVLAPIQGGNFNVRLGVGAAAAASGDFEDLLQGKSGYRGQAPLLR